MSEKAIKHYEKMKDKGENVYIDTLTYEQFMLLGDKELSRRFSMQDEAEQKAKIGQGAGKLSLNMPMSRRKRRTPTVPMEERSL